MFGDRLKKLREDKELKQKDLSKIIGVSDRTIGMYEQGRREPDFDTLKKLANYFNVSIDYLLGRTDNKELYKDTYTGKELSDLVPEEWKEAISDMEYLKFYKRVKKEDINPDELIQAYKIYQAYIENAQKNNENNDK